MAIQDLTPELDSKTNNIAVPIAIVIAGALIAGAMIYNSNRNIVADTGDEVEQRGSLDQMLPVTSEDHIRGNPDAPVKIVEYSDTECPFCKRFHTTMQQVMEEYGNTGQVAWVYRHFPIDQLHSKARREAVATECAGELGGNDKFWAYLDRMMEITPANNGLDLIELPKIAQYIGLNTQEFNECLTSGRYDEKIENHVQNAVATGGNGTPWSIVVGKNVKKYPLSGAQPYTAVKQLIELALQGK